MELMFYSSFQGILVCLGYSVVLFFNSISANRSTLTRAASGGAACDPERAHLPKAFWRNSFLWVTGQSWGAAGVGAERFLGSDGGACGVASPQPGSVSISRWQQPPGAPGVRTNRPELGL